MVNERKWEMKIQQQQCTYTFTIEIQPTEIGAISVKMNWKILQISRFICVRVCIYFFLSLAVPTHICVDSFIHRCKWTRKKIERFFECWHQSSMRAKSIRTIKRTIFIHNNCYGSINSWTLNVRMCKKSCHTFMNFDYIFELHHQKRFFHSNALAAQSVQPGSSYLCLYCVYMLRCIQIYIYQHKWWPQSETE